MNVTLYEVMHAARTRRASLVAETAGYLLLGVADQIAGAPRSILPEEVELTPEGSIRVLGGVPSSALEAERTLRGILLELLLSSCSATPALLRSGQREPQSGVDALIRELEAALIPVNRAAARRALSRLHRETARAAGSVVVESRVERPRQSQLPPKLSVKPPPVENVREPMRRVVRVPGGLSTEERPAVATEIVAEPTEPPPRVVAPVLPVQKPPTPPPPLAPYPEPPSLIPPEVSIPLRFDQVCHEPVTRPEPVVVRATIRRTLPESRTPLLGSLAVSCVVREPARDDEGGAPPAPGLDDATDPMSAEIELSSCALEAEIIERLDDDRTLFEEADPRSEGPPPEGVAVIAVVEPPPFVEPEAAEPALVEEEVPAELEPPPLAEEPTAVAAPEPEPEAAVAAEPEPEPEAAVAAEPEPEPEAVVAAEPEAVVAAEPEPEPEAVVAAEPEPAPNEPVDAPELEPEPAVAPPEIEPSQFDAVRVESSIALPDVVEKLSELVPEAERAAEAEAVPEAELEAVPAELSDEAPEEDEIEVLVVLSEAPPAESVQEWRSPEPPEGTIWCSEQLPSPEPLECAPPAAEEEPPVVEDPPLVVEDPVAEEAALVAEEAPPLVAENEAEPSAALLEEHDACSLSFAACLVEVADEPVPISVAEADPEPNSAPSLEASSELVAPPSVELSAEPPADEKAYFSPPATLSVIDAGWDKVAPQSEAPPASSPDEGYEPVAAPPPPEAEPLEALPLSEEAPLAVEATGCVPPPDVVERQEPKATPPRPPPAGPRSHEEAPPRFLPRQSDVNELLASFSASGTRSERELCGDLKRLAGLEPTPPPPGTQR